MQIKMQQNFHSKIAKLRCSESSVFYSTTSYTCNLTAGKSSMMVTLTSIYIPIPSFSQKPLTSIPVSTQQTDWAWQYTSSIIIVIFIILFLLFIYCYNYYNYGHPV